MVCSLLPLLQLQNVPFDIHFLILFTSLVTHYLFFIHTFPTHPQAHTHPPPLLSIPIIQKKLAMQLPNPNYSADCSTIVPDSCSVKSIPIRPKVHFRDIVAVGYTHHHSDYDRTSIQVGPLTRPDITEIQNMRSSFHKTTQSLYEKRLNRELRIKYRQYCSNAYAHQLYYNNMTAYIKPQTC